MIGLRLARQGSVPPGRGHPEGRPWQRPRTRVAAAAVALGTTVALVPSVVHAAGATLQVAGSSSSCSDTAGAPFCTIAAAAAKATSGDTVQVAAGTYREQVALPPGVTFHGSSGATVQGTNPDGTPAHNYGFLVRGVSGVVIDGFTFQDQGLSGVFLDGASGVTVRDAKVTGSGSYGVRVDAGSSNHLTGLTTQNNTSIGVRLKDTTQSSLTSSVSDHNGYHGVSVVGGSGNRIADVTAFANQKPGTRVATGIDVSGQSANTLVEQNTTYDNDDSGIQLYSGSTGSVVRRNLTYDNGDHGIDVSTAVGSDVVSNTVVGNAASGINVEGVATNTTLRDNIAVDNAVNTPRSQGDIRVESGSEPGTSLNRDLLYQSSSGTAPLVEWASTDYTSLSALRAATGQEQRGINKNPGFASLSGRNLTPAAGSPAIDAADSDATAWKSADRNGTNPVDNPGVTDTGHGTPSYADIGALERTQTEPPPVVDNPPTAALSFAPRAPKTGKPVTLDASGSTDDHGIATYRFDCGNGNTTGTQAAATTTCTYADAGNYTTSVTVTDTKGQQDTAEQSVSVRSGPTARLTVDPPQPQQLQRVTLDASGSTGDQGITQYRFHCAHGHWKPIQASAQTTCRWRNPGDRHVRVRVFDADGLTSTTRRLVRVVPGDPPAARLHVGRHYITNDRGVWASSAASSSGSGYAPIRRYAVYCHNGGHNRVSHQPVRIRCRWVHVGLHKVTLRVVNTLGRSDLQSRYVRVMRR